MFYQGTLFDLRTPAEVWNDEAAKHALDELFNGARQYRFSRSYQALIAFISRFRFYSPYNSMLLHLQMAGTSFVAPATRWRDEYGRTVKPTARPLVILQPMGPVMFVFDVADTEPLPDAKPLPREVEYPFETTKGNVGSAYTQTIENAKRDGVRIQLNKEGSQSGGSIRTVGDAGIPPQKFQIGLDRNREPVYTLVPVRYDLLMNEKLSQETRYATVVHELAHLYCGHLGTPNKKWWPDRSRGGLTTEEFEAESVCYIVCKRMGIEHSSEAYLSYYLEQNNEIPPISIECVLKSAGLIEQMGRMRLKERKDA